MLPWSKDKWLDSPSLTDAHSVPFQLSLGSVMTKIQWEFFRTLQWRCIVLCKSIFCGDIPLHCPYIGFLLYIVNTFNFDSRNGHGNIPKFPNTEIVAIGVFVSQSAWHAAMVIIWYHHYLLTMTDMGTYNIYMCIYLYIYIDNSFQLQSNEWPGKHMEKQLKL